MGNSRKRSGDSSRRKIAAVVAVGALAVAALGVSAAAVLRTQGDASEPSVSFSAQAPVLPSPTLTARVKIAQAMDRLNDPSRPFTLVVLGDSTGADAVSWPTMLGEWLGATYDRPVSLHPWSEGTKPPAYQPVRTLASGAHAAVTIYNGSAPSRNAAYSLSELDKFIPVDGSSVDMVLISHGHNQGPSTLRSQFFDLSNALLAKTPNASIVAIAQNPEKVGSPHAQIQEENLASLRLMTDGANFETIDVHKAFVNYGDFSSLYKDNVHPADAKGYRIWADAVIAVLKG